MATHHEPSSESEKKVALTKSPAAMRDFCCERVFNGSYSGMRQEF